MRAVIGLLTLVVVALPLTAKAEGFTQELFDAWLDMRIGDGTSPKYWYAEGQLKSFPDGKTTAKMIGFDTGHLLRDPDDPTKATHLSRKIFFWFDPETGLRLDKEPIAYEYQVKTYELDGEDVIYSVESRSGERVSHVLPTRDNYSAKRIGDVIWFNYPVFINRGAGKFENSDFYIQPSDGLSEQERYQHVWVSYGPGPIVSRAVAWRYSSFDEMPDQITEIVRQEAPLWMEPPQSMEEIEELRNAVQAASAE